MATTPVKSPRKEDILDSVKKAALVAKWAFEEYEEKLGDLGRIKSETETEISTEAQYIEPSSSKQKFSSPCTDGKENCALIAKPLKSGGVSKQGYLLFDFNKISKSASTPKEAISPSKIGDSTKDNIKDGTKSPLANLFSNGLSENEAVDKEVEADGLSEKVKVSKEVMEEDLVVYETKAKPSRLECDGETSLGWTKMEGSLQLYWNKATGETRLVHRNMIGTVKMNLAIRGNMVCLDKIDLAEVKRGRNKRRKVSNWSYIRFVAIAGEETGVEYFSLKVKRDKVDTLYEKLKELGAETVEVGMEEA